MPSLILPYSLELLLRHRKNEFPLHLVANSAPGGVISAVKKGVL